MNVLVLYMCIHVRRGWLAIEETKRQIHSAVCFFMSPFKRFGLQSFYSNKQVCNLSSLSIQGTKLDCTIEQWAKCFADNHIQFSSPSESGSGMNTEPASEAEFPEVYHKLIHSPALETLLQLEHTYAMAVTDVCKGWENATTVLHDRCVPLIILLYMYFACNLYCRFACRGLQGQVPLGTGCVQSWVQCKHTVGKGRFSIRSNTWL